MYVPAEAMLDALKTDNFDNFEVLLADDVKTIVYNDKTIYGKDKTLDYWKDWKTKHEITIRFDGFQIANHHYKTRCYPLYNRTTIILFQMIDDKIHGILQRPGNLSPDYPKGAEDGLDYSFKYERIKQYLLPLIDKIDIKGNPIKITDRIPCWKCDLDSSKLNWYKAKFPNYHNHYWEYGQVSVCPQCGRVIEYKKLQRVESKYVVDNYKGPKYPNEDNVYSKIAAKLYTKEMIEGFKAGEREEFVSNLISQLISIKLDPDYSIAIEAIEKDGFYKSQLCVYDKKGNKSTDFIKHLKVRYTEKVAWQLYLLYYIFTFLPYSGLSMPYRRKYIFKTSDIDAIIPLKYYDLSDLFKRKKILPEVRLTKYYNNLYMEVSCTYLDGYGSLCRENVSFRFKNGHITSYETYTSGSEVLCINE